MGRLIRLLRPPRIIAITRRPAGWVAVDHRGRLAPILAWAVLADDDVVGLIAKRRGLSPARGRGWIGFLAPLHSSVRHEPPPVIVPIADLTEAIPLGAGNPFAPEALAELYAKLKTAAEAEWARATLRSFLDDPARLVRRYLEMLVEHSRPAELDDDWRAALAAITSPAVAAAEVNPVDSCQGGNA